MRQLIILLVFFVLSSFITAQELIRIEPTNDKPGAVLFKTEDSTIFYQYQINELHDQITLSDQFLVAPYYKNIQHNSNQSSMIESLDSIEPGVSPEADLPYRIKYTSDGLQLLVIYHHSDNLFIYDTESYEVLAIVELGLGPESMFVSDQFVFVSCFFSNEVYIISLEDYTITDCIVVEPQPCVLKVNEDESIMYVGFPGEGFSIGYLVAYDLDTHEPIFTNYLTYITRIWGLEGVGRQVHTYSNFFLVNDDQLIACIDQGSHSLLFIDALNGEILKEFNSFISAIAPTSSKDSIYTAGILNGNAGIRFQCINTSTMEIVDSIIIPSNMMPMAMFWQDNLSIDATNSKLHIELGTFSLESLGYFADFSDSSYQEFNLSNILPRYRSVESFDNRYVILPGSVLGIFDFEIEQYTTNQNIQFPAAAKVFDASPNDYKFAWHDNYYSFSSTNLFGEESIEVYDFSIPSSISYDTVLICGEAPEADLTFSAILNSKHDKIIACNSMSGNISLIDASTFTLDSILDIPGITNAVCINDDLVALSGFYNNIFYLYDLSKMIISDQFNIGNATRACIIPSPNKQTFYSYNSKNNYLVKYEIIENIAYRVDSLYIKDTGVAVLPWRLYYTPEISPDGKYLVFQENEDLKIVDTDKMEVICIIPSIPPVIDIAFTEDSKRICLAHLMSYPYVTIIYLNGSHSYLEHTVYTNNEGGYATAYNPINQKFYCARTSDIYIVDPSTGSIDDIISLDAKDRIMQIDLDPEGLPIVMSWTYFYYNDQEYFLRHPAQKFSIDSEYQHCVFPSPGPDRIFILDFLSTNLYEIPVISNNLQLNLYPNPANTKVTISSNKLIDRIRIFDENGKIIETYKPNSLNIDIYTSDYTPGIYIIEAESKKAICRKKVVVGH
ncbi:MAG: T9SS type A sorting domain-containing protein [Bacteroidales bacterium]|nr:T9SS type A sorting domain-containing protein [Bacteroidales bacterium]